jgi:hypothetical protein
MLFYSLALLCTPVLLALALTTGSGPFALNATLMNTIMVNVASWLISAILLSSRWATSRMGFRQSYDIFLSYRVGSDAELVDRLHDKLVAAGLRVWFDKKCLVGGKKWQEGFLEGLSMSAVFVPVLSVPGLASMSKLRHDSRVDNWLAEWRLALELEERGHAIIGVFPVFVGPPHEGSNLYIDNFFSAASALELPAEPVAAIEDLVARSLAANSLEVQAPKDHGDVQATFRRITEFQGVKMLGERTVALENVVREVRSAVDAAAAVDRPSRERRASRRSRRGQHGGLNGGHAGQPSTTIDPRPLPGPNGGGHPSLGRGPASAPTHQVKVAMDIADEKAVGAVQHDDHHAAVLSC